MSIPATSCCAAVLMQHQQTLQQHSQHTAAVSEKPEPSKPKNCTVVENGRVVVKPLPEAATGEPLESQQAD